MALDIFGRVPADYGGSFAADAAVVTFGLGPGLVGGVGLLTQSINFTYKQTINRIYEVGSRATFYIAGRTNGIGNIARVLGPRPVTQAFYQAYGNICRANQNTLLFQVVQGCNVPTDTGAGFSFALTGVVIDSINMSVNAEQMFMAEQLSIMFISMIV